MYTDDSVVAKAHRASLQGFGFGEALLLQIYEAFESCRFSTFLFDSAKQAATHNGGGTTVVLEVCSTVSHVVGQAGARSGSL